MIVKKSGQISSNVLNEIIALLKEENVLYKCINIKLDDKTLKFLLDKNDGVDQYLNFVKDSSDENKIALINKLFEYENIETYIKLDLDLIKSLYESKEINKEIAEKILNKMYKRKLKVCLK